MHSIAIEPNLTPIKDYLSSKGYHVESMSFDRSASSWQAKNFDAIIVTGLNDNLAGINDTNTKAVVIEAKGLTPEQILHELQLRLD
ncbi:MAG: YkuS family protein [Clostridiales bacterium]|jgi:hypothetical protein|nr:YkuS family protein [Eubacteriales bacterium]MDH7566397.1 YkuS family protein [Clostridiales bacterium]